MKKICLVVEMENSIDRGKKIGKRPMQSIIVRIFWKSDTTTHSLRSIYTSYIFFFSIFFWWGRVLFSCDIFIVFFLSLHQKHTRARSLLTLFHSFFTVIYIVIAYRVLDYDENWVLLHPFNVYVIIFFGQWTVDHFNRYQIPADSLPFSAIL